MFITNSDTLPNYHGAIAKIQNNMATKYRNPVKRRIAILLGFLSIYLA